MSRTPLVVMLPSFGPFLQQRGLHTVVDLARRAEAAGVESVLVPEHVVMGEHVEQYQWGPFPLPVDTPFLDPLCVLAAVAAATERIRLATGILIAPLRPAAVLAKTAASLDVLSRGRLDLGVGVGWQREEYEACGVDFEQRGRLLTDCIAACRALWTQSPASFAGGSLRFERIWCEPRPVQPGGIPVFFSGTLHRRNLERITRLGDGWIPIMGETPAGLGEGVKRIRDAWAAAGRDPARLRVRGTLAPALERGRPHLRRTLEGAAALAALGATELELNALAFLRGPEAADDFFGELAETRKGLV